MRKKNLHQLPRIAQNVEGGAGTRKSVKFKSLRNSNGAFHDLSEGFLHCLPGAK